MANSLDDVVSGALRVLDAYGLEYCTMRRVAGELGVQPSALYHHVADKQTLLGLMADRVVAPVEVDADLAAPSQRLRTAMLAGRDGAEVGATTAAFRLGQFALETALADHSDRDVARTLLLYVVGHTQATQLHRQAAAVGIVEADPDLDASFERGLAIILR
ncbi:TetR family transcriptional regulator [Aeromicrobium sp.]|uniref:TetR family transcriptional regulator n=1 Tax=Aeromicrobium sp. TaxID=1871063 RepID=UPI003519CC41